MYVCNACRKHFCWLFVTISMETVNHLWNVNQFMTKLESPLITELQTFYMQKCKNFRKSVELPTKNFGPSAMCSHCGSLWNTVDNQVRISRGRKMSKSVKRIIQNMNKNSNQKIPKVRASLMQKAMKNEMNKLVIKCSVCSKNTELPLKKKSRLKPAKLNNFQVETLPNKHKKKRKKSRDKTAGLNISGYISELQFNKKNNSKTFTKSPVITPKINNKKLPISPTKPEKMKHDIQRLKKIMERNATKPMQSKGLHSFLMELC